MMKLLPNRLHLNFSRQQEYLSYSSQKIWFNIIQIVPKLVRKISNPVLFSMYHHLKFLSVSHLNVFHFRSFIINFVFWMVGYTEHTLQNWFWPNFNVLAAKSKRSLEALEWSAQRSGDKNKEDQRDVGANHGYSKIHVPHGPLCCTCSVSAGIFCENFLYGWWIF